MPNVGIRLTDPQVAEGILMREKKMGILGKVSRRIAGPDCFRKKPDYKGGGQGPATVDEFIAYTRRLDVIEKYGEVDLRITPGDADRERKIRQFRNRLVIQKDGSLPMLVVYDDCKAFIRTIPALCNDDVNPEDYLEDGQEDHVYDEACHICQYFPVGTTDDEVQSIIRDKEKQAKKAKLDTASRAALEEWSAIIEEIEGREEAPSWLL